MGNEQYRKGLIARFNSYSCGGNVRKNLGPLLMDEAIKEFGSIAAMKKYELGNEIGWLKRVSKFSYINVNSYKGIEGVSFEVFRKKLSKLGELGFEIKSHSKMSKEEMYNYLEKMRKDWGKEINKLEYQCHFDELDTNNISPELLYNN